MSDGIGERMLAHTVGDGGARNQTKYTYETSRQKKRHQTNIVATTETRNHHSNNTNKQTN